MTGFFKDDNGNFSMGRLVTFVTALNAIVIFNIKVIMTTGDIGSNVANACIWMIAAAIGGKGLQKIGENMKK